MKFIMLVESSKKSKSGENKPYLCHFQSVTKNLWAISLISISFHCIKKSLLVNEIVETWIYVFVYFIFADLWCDKNFSLAFSSSPSLYFVYFYVGIDKISKSVHVSQIECDALGKYNWKLTETSQMYRLIDINIF